MSESFAESANNNVANNNASVSLSSSHTGHTTSTTGTGSLVVSTPAESVFVPPLRPQQNAPPPPEDEHRAIHKVRLSALKHNFAQVEIAAKEQQCNVIAVVKGDGYGHGAIASALHLADRCGVGAFAVATLEEAIALRRGFERNPPGKWSKQLAALFHTGGVNASAPATTGTAIDASTTGPARSDQSPSEQAAARITRPAHIRIVVLGPPVGFPRCFDDYYHHNIELMVSGPEVAMALMEWVRNSKERLRLSVERTAREFQASSLLAAPFSRMTTENSTASNDESVGCDPGSTQKNAPIVKRATESISLPSVSRKLPHASSTLGSVTGPDLYNEMRSILLKQKEALTAQAETATTKSTSSSTANSEASPSDEEVARVITPPPVTQAAKNRVAHPTAAQLFNAGATPAPVSANASTKETANNRKQSRLRWHGLVDSGMGRLGFKTEPVPLEEKVLGRSDTVDILREMVAAENDGSPIEFYGLCTHMAEATSKSDYTHSQIARFIQLLNRVRDAGLSIPSISTDNSSALLTTSLTHFQPTKILHQEGKPDSLGFVRTGGAIYGQRPDFPQLRAVSTLMASVRHVAVLQKGESVGYDRAYCAPYNVLIATLTIGFADGYPRELGNGIGKVQIRGCVFPVAGNVCMDMVMVELGPVEDQESVGSKVTVGDTAVLWGPLEEDDGEGLVPLRDLAAALKTTQSALTCGLDKIRVRRLFV